MSEIKNIEQTETPDIDTDKIPVIEDVNLEKDTEDIEHIKEIIECRKRVNKSARKKAFKIIESLELTEDDIEVFKLLPFEDNDLLELAMEMKKDMKKISKEYKDEEKLINQLCSDIKKDIII